MANSSKDKGTKGETAVVRWLQANGFPDAKRNVLGGRFDPGDVEPIPAQVPPIIISVKAGYGTVHPQTKLWAKWWADLEATRLGRSPYGLGLLVHKRDGKASPEFWNWYVELPHVGPVMVTGPQALRLMRAWRVNESDWPEGMTP